MRLWDATSGQCQAIIQGFNDTVDSLAWKGDYLVTRCGDSVRVWRLYQVGNQVQVNLCWSSTHGVLTVTEATIQDAQGLSPANQKLLAQRKVVGKPRKAD